MKVITFTRRLLADWFAASWHVVRFAPWLVLPILLAEGMQHVIEILLGMFASRADAIALSNDGTRMAFGYVKVACLVISILLIARAVALGSAARAVRPRWQSIAQLAVILPLLVALDFIFRSGAARAIAPDPLLQGANILLQAMLMVPLLAALFDHDWRELRAARWRVIPALLLSLLLAAVAFAPLQILHMYNHRWALGAPTVAVWALMLFDTLCIALLALMVGSATAVGWRRFVGSHDAPRDL